MLYGEEASTDPEVVTSEDARIDDQATEQGLISTQNGDQVFHGAWL